MENSFAGALFLVPGLLLGWALLGWVASAREQERLEARHRELQARLAEAGTGDDLAGRLAHLTRERVKLESSLLEVELARQKGLKTIAELSRRLGAEREPAEDSPPPVDEEAQRRARAEHEFVRKLNYVLRTAGATWLRVHEVGSRDGSDLRDVRLLVLGEDGLVEGLYSAGACRIILDRATGILTLDLRDVVKVLRGERAALAEQRLEFEAADPRALELELESVLLVRGDYPAPRPEAPPVADIAAVELWRERLDAFLAYAAGDSRLELHGLQSVEAATFYEVDILGYSAKGLWERRLHGRKLEIWVDTDTNAVELRLFDGFVESGLGRTSFPDRWYRYPLAGVDRREAERILTGYVKRWPSLGGTKDANGR